MHNEFTSIIEKDDGWFISYCLEIPRANGHRRTVEECRERLSEAVNLILKDRRDDTLHGVPEEAIHETVTLQ